MSPSADHSLARAVAWSSHVARVNEDGLEEAAVEVALPNARARRRPAESPEMREQVFRQEIVTLAMAVGMIFLLWVTAGVL